MSEASRIRLNSVFSFLSISIRLISNIFVFLLIARYYGAENFGRFTFAHSLAAIFILFADFGFDVLLTTEIARDRKNAISNFQIYFSFKIIFCLIALVSMWIIALSTSLDPESRVLILIFSFYVIFTALTNFLFALFKGFELLQYETKISFIINVTLLVVIIVLKLYNISINFIALFFVFSRILGLIFSVRASSKILPGINYHPKFTRWREVRSKVMVFGVHLLFSNLFFQLDTLLIAFIRGEYEVGIYQAVFKLVLLPLIIPDVIINALLPVLSRTFSENPERWEKLGRIMNKLLILVSLPVTMILFVYAKPIIEIVYNAKEFLPAIPVLRIFALILFVRFTVETYALMLTTSNRQHKRMLVVVIATLLNFGINLYMISNFGFLGAAYTSLLTNVLVGIGYIFYTYPLIRNWLINIKIFSLIGFVLVVSIILWNYTIETFWYSAPLAFLTVSIILYFTGLTKSEREQILAEQKILSRLSTKRFL